MKKLALILPILVTIDQITKFIFQEKAYLYKGLGIDYATNTGAAFGILKGNNFFLAIIAIIVICFIFYYYKKVDKHERTGLLLILAGTLGNLTDRIFFGYVRDFIALPFWPNFNFADMYNTIGVLILIVSSFKHKKP